MVSFSLLNAIDPTTIVFIVLLALLIVALLVVPMFTNKKRAKQTDELHRSLQPGDLIETIGGVIGTIVEVRQISPVDKEMVIETGVGDRKTTMVIDIQALYKIMSRSSTIVSANDKAEETEEAATEENNEPKREVPPIMADRTPETEVKEESVNETATEAEADESEAKDTVAAPEQTDKTAPAAQKNSGAKKNKK